jgi:uncharacterized protein YkwD
MQRGWQAAARAGILGMALLVVGMVESQGPAKQSPALAWDEARTVYLGNLARRENGLPPLRWNRQLTDAARWFAWDSVENRTDFCGNQDTQGHWPDWRARAFGYRGRAGAENAFCGYVTPQGAISGWMNSPGHRANLLDPNHREVGLGYYRRESDGRGYVVQDFGYDPVYAPVIIENEIPAVEQTQVNLYIYDRTLEGGFAGMGPAVEMMISNNAQFSGARWEPYRAEKSWTLLPGEGWRTVWVKTRDAWGRTAVASDMVYLGTRLPDGAPWEPTMSTTQEQVTVVGLDGRGLPYVQFSLGWLVDDTFGTFGLLWGMGERVQDGQAWGGSAFTLRYDAQMESSAWVWTTEFYKNVPLVAYVRMKVSDNRSSDEVARFQIAGGGVTYGPLRLKGTDFQANDQYQEFPLTFTFCDNPQNSFLIFQFWRSGAAEVTVDAVTIFTAPQPVQQKMTWQVPGSNYRGQGVWVRYTDGERRFTGWQEAAVVLEDRRWVWLPLIQR